MYIDVVCIALSGLTCELVTVWVWFGVLYLLVSCLFWCVTAARAFNSVVVMSLFY